MIRILLLDDHCVVRSDYRRLLGADNDFKRLRLAMRHGLVEAPVELSC